LAGVKALPDVPFGSKKSYSITSSAAMSSGVRIIKPRAFAVLRLIANLSTVGCSTGTSLRGAKRGWNVDAELPRRLEIDHLFELGELGFSPLDDPDMVASNWRS
jgi:hypothetical protein